MKSYKSFEDAIHIARDLNVQRGKIFCPKAHASCRINCIEYQVAHVVAVPTDKNSFIIKGGKCKYYGK